MADDEEPEVEDEVEEVEDVDEDEDEVADPHLFGIDLGRRGDRVEQLSRDEVDAPKPVRERAATRSLSDRLASAAADRDEAEAERRPAPSTSDEDE